MDAQMSATAYMHPYNGGEMESLAMSAYVASIAPQPQQAKPKKPAQHHKKKEEPRTVVTPTSDVTHPSPLIVGVIEREVVYTAETLYSNGTALPDFDATVTLSEDKIGGNSAPTTCSPSCSQQGGMPDDIYVANTKSTFRVEQTFKVNGKPVGIARLQNGKVTLATRQVVDATATKITITPEQ